MKGSFFFMSDLNFVVTDLVMLVVFSIIIFSIGCNMFVRDLVCMVSYFSIGMSKIPKIIMD